MGFNSSQDNIRYRAVADYEREANEGFNSSQDIVLYRSALAYEQEASEAAVANQNAPQSKNNHAFIVRLIISRLPAFNKHTLHRLIIQLELNQRI